MNYSIRDGEGFVERIVFKSDWFLISNRILLRHFLEFSAAYRQNLVHDQDLVCAPPGSQSPAGLPAIAYLSAPSASVRAPNALRTRASHTSRSYTGWFARSRSSHPSGYLAAASRAAAPPPGSPACRYTEHSQKNPQSHRTSARFGLLSSRFAKPCGPACGTR